MNYSPRHLLTLWALSGVIVGIVMSTGAPSYWLVAGPLILAVGDLVLLMTRPWEGIAQTRAEAYAPRYDISPEQWYLSRSGHPSAGVEEPVPEKVSQPHGPPLSVRDRAILMQILDGRSVDETAKNLDLSPETVWLTIGRLSDVLERIARGR